MYVLKLKDTVLQYQNRRDLVTYGAGNRLKITQYYALSNPKEDALIVRQLLRTESAEDYKYTGYLANADDSLSGHLGVLCVVLFELPISHIDVWFASIKQAEVDVEQIYRKLNPEKYQV